MRQKNWISPSILTADFSRLGEEVSNLILSGADSIHVDVMDGHYVPNLSIGPMVCEAMRDDMTKRGVSVPLDVHLMARPVDRLIADFAKAGADFITFHPEASDHVDRSLELALAAGCKTGLALNPATPLAALDYTLEKLDIVLVMSVNPGFGGQQFIPAALEKLRACRELIDASDKAIRLQVDGGIKAENVAAVAAAGCDSFVSGSGIFDHRRGDDPNHYNTIIRDLQAAIAQTVNPA